MSAEKENSDIAVTEDIQNNSQDMVTVSPKRKPRAKKITEKQPEASANQSIIPKDIDPEQYVIVRNGFQGRLIYTSKKTGERFVWDGFGSEQEMTLRELRSAKNTNKTFFVNNWLMFDDDWIVDYLGVKQFYKNAVRIEDFDNIFQEDADTIKEIVTAMSTGQKRSVAYRARQMIISGEIDSRKTIAALEEALGIELIEQ